MVSNSEQDKSSIESWYDQQSVKWGDSVDVARFCKALVNEIQQQNLEGNNVDVAKVIGKAINRLRARAVSGQQPSPEVSLNLVVTEVIDQLGMLDQLPEEALDTLSNQIQEVRNLIRTNFGAGSQQENTTPRADFRNSTENSEGKSATQEVKELTNKLRAALSFLSTVKLDPSEKNLNNETAYEIFNRDFQATFDEIEKSVAFQTLLGLNGSPDLQVAAFQRDANLLLRDITREVERVVALDSSISRLLDVQKALSEELNKGIGVTNIEKQLIELAGNIKKYNDNKKNVPKLFEDKISINVSETELTKLVSLARHSEEVRRREEFVPQLQALRMLLERVNIAPAADPKLDKHSLEVALSQVRSVVASSPRITDVRTRDYIEQYDFAPVELKLSQLTGFFDAEDSRPLIDSWEKIDSIVALKKKIEEVKNIPVDAKYSAKKLSEIREELRTKYRMAEVRGIIQEQLTDPKGFALVKRALRESYQEALKYVEQRFDAKNVAEGSEPNFTMKSYRNTTVRDLLSMFQTNDVDKTNREMHILAWEEKLEELEAAFKRKIKPESEAISQWKAFKELYVSTYALVDFGVFGGRVLYPQDLTVIHEEVLKAAGVPGAMKHNDNFDRNIFVGSLTHLDKDRHQDGLPIEFDHKELDCGPNMGIIQMIVFAAFQEMKKTKNQSRFTRNGGWNANIADELLAEVCKLHAVTMWDGTVKPYDIAAKLEEYPPEIKDSLLLMAKYKASRDDIGGLAALHHLGKNKGAMKIINGPAGRPQGLISSMLYVVGKNSGRERTAAMYAFVDPTTAQIMDDGRPATDLLDYKNWNEHASPQNREAVRFMADEQNYREYEHPEIKNVNRVRYKPKDALDWPGLQHFFNQEAPELPGQYTKATEAMLAIIETATDAIKPLDFPTETTHMVEKVIGMVKNFGSEIGKVLAYSRPPQEVLYDRKSGNVEPGPEPELQYVHELVLAAYEYFIERILVSIPGKVELGAELVPKKLRHLICPNYEAYLIDYDAVVKAIVETIKLNTTLAGYYQYNLIGLAKDMTDEEWEEHFKQKSFVVGSNYHKTYRDEPFLRNGRHRWVFENDPVMFGMPDSRKAEIYRSVPSKPVNVDGGWKTVTEEKKNH